MLDAALDAVSAADIHIKMYAHRSHRQFEHGRKLVRIFWHLHRSIDVENFTPGVPARDNTKCLDRYSRAASPFDAMREVMRALGKVLFHLAPDEIAIQQYVAAVTGMHGRATRRECSFAIEH